MAAIPRSPSPFRGYAAPSLSRWEREKPPKAAKGEGRRVALCCLAFLTLAVPAESQPVVDQRQRLVAAKRDAVIATRRAEALARDAAAERNAADKARAEEAALAARVRAAEANLAAARARQAIETRLLADQQTTLATQQAPVARLLAALTALARRPAVVAIAQPGSIDDLVHVRAVLGGALPLVQQRTDGVRRQIARTRGLEQDAAVAAAALRRGRAQLETDRAGYSIRSGDLSRFRHENCFRPFRPGHPVARKARSAVSR
jgi:septal ring factor EnvC (AmiA/AmiB activator)